MRFRRAMVRSQVVLYKVNNNSTNIAPFLPDVILLLDRLAAADDTEPNTWHPFPSKLSIQRPGRAHGGEVTLSSGPSGPGQELASGEYTHVLSVSHLDR